LACPILNQPFLCEFCLADNEVRKEICERGIVVDICPICGNSGGRALSANDNKIGRIFRALIRLNFSEWDYNPHIGGEPSLERLVFDSKVIFNLGEHAWGDAFEAMYIALEGESWYPALGEDISLGGGYWDGCVLDGLRAKRDVDVDDILKSSLSLNSYEIEPKVRELISYLRQDVSCIIPSGSEFFRARIGVHARLKRKSVFANQREEFVYTPFMGKDIDRPPLAIAKEGRFNKSGVSLLYLASDVATAISELRPHPHHLVSTARFQLKRDCLVANFAHFDIRNFLSDQRLEDLRKIISIGEALNAPVQPEHRILYVVTQLFGDAIRNEGFEGVWFKSTVGSGDNFTFFANDAFQLVPESSNIHEIISLKYDLLQVPIGSSIVNNEEFYVDDGGPFATLTHGMSRNGSVRSLKKR
jgi:hypothetical protein